MAAPTPAAPRLRSIAHLDGLPLDARSVADDVLAAEGR